MNFFQQFVFNRAGVARTGEPVNLPQGGQHVPSRGDVLPQEAQHVLGVEDVRVPGFCRTQGTHLLSCLKIYFTKLKPFLHDLILFLLFVVENYWSSGPFHSILPALGIFLSKQICCLKFRIM